jgi:hypothetical protein
VRQLKRELCHTDQGVSWSWSRARRNEGETLQRGGNYTWFESVNPIFTGLPVKIHRFYWGKHLLRFMLTVKT